MIYKKSGPLNTPLTTVRYEFLAPTRIKIRSKDGSNTLVGYGIGERIEVLEPAMQYLIVNHEILNEIPMADGRTIVAWEEDIKTQLVWID